MVKMENLDGKVRRLRRHHSSDAVDIKPNINLIDRTQAEGHAIKTYRPTMEEMKDFNAFMRHVHATGGHRAGLCKIVPPPGYKPRKAGYANKSLYEMKISNPIQQEISGGNGLYQQLNVVNQKKITVRNFKLLAEEKHPTPEHNNPETDLEQHFWNSLTENPAIYGADVSATLFDEDCDEFNLTRLHTILDHIKEDYGITIQGVNTNYLYFGMWKTAFCWHTEDMDLYSINYLHTGAPKYWYCIAPEYGKRFERLAASFFPQSHKLCRAFLRHKTTLISPEILSRYSIPFSKCIQYPGEFMVTFPFSYHSGYNQGFNIAEATNFALEYWIEFGKWATQCECSSGHVKVSMQTFVERYQPDRYEKWLQGSDVCKDPKDPEYIAAAPKPTEHDLYVIGAHEDDNDRKRKTVEQLHQLGNKKKKLASQRSHAFKTACGLYQEFLESYKSIHYDDTRSLQLPLQSQATVHMVPMTEFVPSSLLKLTRTGRVTRPEPVKIRINHQGRKVNERKLPNNDLLNYMEIHFSQEVQFNRRMATLPPHCSICQLFVTLPKDDKNIRDLNKCERRQSKIYSNEDRLVREFELPESSKILLPKGVFDIEPRDQLEPVDCVSGPEQECEVIDESSKFFDVYPEESTLIQCSLCMVAVHQFCYGIDKLPVNKKSWICDRCLEEDRNEISCILCPCRGGSMKAMGKNWYHITCALSDPATNFVDLFRPKGRSYSRSKLPDGFDRLVCFYCEQNYKIAKYVGGKCIRCAGYLDLSTGEKVVCNNSFHTTCGHRNGSRFDCIDYHLDPTLKQRIKGTCTECLSESKHFELEIDADARVGLDPLERGVVVIGWSNIERTYLDGYVDTVEDLARYDVFYPDSSEIESRIERRFIKKIADNGRKDLIIGEKVIVRDKRANTREGKVRGSGECEVYYIKFFRTQRTERVERQHIYLNVDQMPEDLLETYFTANGYSRPKLELDTLAIPEPI